MGTNECRPQSSHASVGAALRPTKSVPKLRSGVLPVRRSTLPRTSIGRVADTAVSPSSVEQRKQPRGSSLRPRRLRSSSTNAGGRILSTATGRWRINEHDANASERPRTCGVRERGSRGSSTSGSSKGVSTATTTTLEQSIRTTWTAPRRTGMSHDWSSSARRLPGSVQSSRSAFLAVLAATER